ncbi:hypothetical protein GCM10007981_01270 [Thermocladium modestius]|uniref:Uncharacterized protein n=1 Tax=Thermocladium modestius TaxID=62609 RepID=A0A830GTH5_9CREN|nr:hypothetical protein [Thermocladium modestius]GGP19071.1 hypothetical protein GCM10007981_01270 [Thermocladium modestius]
MQRNKITSTTRLLNAIRQFNSQTGRDPYTRELLRLLRSWGYGESVLRSLEEAGLVERYRDRCSAGTRRRCVFNKLTEKGLDYLAHAELVMAIPTPKTREIAVDF